MTWERKESMISPHLATLIDTLQTLTPMPDDEILNALPEEGNPMDRLYEILMELKQEIQKTYPLEIISPLLEVFGTGTGNGVYWSIVHLLEHYPDPQQFYPLIQQATRSTNPGTRAWSCLLLGRRRNREDGAFLVERLQDPIPIVRQYALTGIIMLSQCYAMTHLLPLVEPLLHDEDEEVRHTARDASEALSRPSYEEGS